jgi:hypothetical protein
MPYQLRKTRCGCGDRGLHATVKFFLPRHSTRTKFGKQSDVLRSE